MSDYLPFAFFVIGLIGIIKGSDMFIDAVIWIARVTRIPDLIIGATLVSICTTLPETMVSASSALRGNTDLAFGNALGSIACNTGFILATTIIFSRPALRDKKKIQKKGILLVLLLMIIALSGFVFGEISRLLGTLLLGVLVWYLINSVQESLRDQNAWTIGKKGVIDYDRKTSIKYAILFVIGLALTILCSNLLVINGEKIALLMGVPDIVIGLTVTAFGTSLPEFMTAITALRKKAHDISLGNILGANIFNVILVIALSATILPIPIDINILRLHLPFTFLIVASTVAFSFINKSHFRRRNGVMLLATYTLYILLIVKVL